MPGAGPRRWGWHPLREEWAASIVAASPVRPGDTVLDLGAGDGALTRPLLDASARVLAIEAHPGRAARLRTDLRHPELTVVEADLRDLRLPGRPFRVVASPPYALSSDLVRLLLSSHRLLSADLVLQRATARRLARPDRHFAVSVGPTVPRSAFRTPPRVDSAVLRLRRRGPGPRSSRPGRGGPGPSRRRSRRPR